MVKPAAHRPTIAPNRQSDMAAMQNREEAYLREFKSMEKKLMP